MPKKSKEEWNQLIKECRESGLSDRQWCLLNGIPPSTMYGHVKRLRREGGDIPFASKLKVISATQDIVQVHLSDEPKIRTVETAQLAQYQDISTPAIVIDIHGFSVSVFNNATPSIISSTIGMLRSIC
jgi:transposase-like protein